MKTTILATLLTLAITPLVSSDPAQACELASVPLTESVRIASEVFEATVDHIVTLKDNSGAERRAAIVTVDKSFRHCERASCGPWQCGRARSKQKGMHG